MLRISCLLVAALMLPACSEPGSAPGSAEPGNSNNKDQLFKQERGALKNAAELEQTLQDAAAKQRRIMEEQSR